MARLMASSAAAAPEKVCADNVAAKAAHHKSFISLLCRAANTPGVGVCCKVGRAILPAAGFQPAFRESHPTHSSIAVDRISPFLSSKSSAIYKEDRISFYLGRKRSHATQICVADFPEVVCFQQAT